MKHIPPILGQQSFHCPHCGVLSAQQWSSNIHCHYTGQLPNGGQGHTQYVLQNTMTSKCGHCQQISIWINQKMVYPLTGNVEMANPDLPADIMNDYNEAKDIVNISPRGSAALLRLAVQKLCVHLGEKGKNINDDIASLVKKGMPVQLQQALDSVRVIGNHAVHPGVIDLDDKPETAYALFSFVNIICDFFITQPKKINEVFINLPQKDKDNIAKRDS
ncbi:MAG: DUF4145 domain-containing protein [Hydrotalea sp. AMD]|nr:MAG: DUF4145 domain-containing protein [Hydrotalea sp. AMD]